MTKLYIGAITTESSIFHPSCHLLIENVNVWVVLGFTDFGHRDVHLFSDVIKRLGACLVILTAPNKTVKGISYNKKSVSLANISKIWQLACKQIHDGQKAHFEFCIFEFRENFPYRLSCWQTDDTRDVLHWGRWTMYNSCNSRAWSSRLSRCQNVVGKLQIVAGPYGHQSEWACQPETIYFCL